MTSLGIDEALSTIRPVTTARWARVRAQTRSERHFQRAIVTYLLALAAALGVAAAMVGFSGPAVWAASGLVAAALALDFLASAPYERLRSLRSPRLLFMMAAAAMVVATAFDWLSPSQVRGVMFVVAAPSAVIAAAVLYQRVVPVRRSVLLVGGRLGVGRFISEWSSREDIDVQGVCLSEFVDASAQEMLGIPILGSLDDVAAVAIELGVDQVVVAPGPLVSDFDVRRLSWGLEDSSIELFVAADVHGAAPRRIRPTVVGQRLMLSVQPGRAHRVARVVKGVIDRIGAALLICALAPVLLVIGVMIRRDSPGPAFFKQTRIGLDGKPFRMYKFRTMVVDAESLLTELLVENEGAGPLFKLSNDPRTTRVGRVLRRTSLDELPQLFNVLKGEMSLIGPRPGLPDETAQYDDWVSRRLRVKPGMTGMWQVSGRSNLNWEDSVRLDLDYVDNWTIRTDFAIAAKTARAVVQRDGAM